MPVLAFTSEELDTLAAAAGTTQADIQSHYTTQDQIRIAKALALYISQH